MKDITIKIISIFIILILMINLFPPTITFAEGETNNEQEDIQKTEEVTRNYEIKSEEEWDVSENGDKSVKAKWTLKDKTLRISGNGKMKDWSNWSSVDYAKYIKILEKIIVEDGITKIGNYAFSEENKKISINNIRAIKNRNPVSIQIPKSVISIGNNAFDSISGLTSIYVDDNNANYASLNGVLYTKGYKELLLYPSYKEDDTYTVHSNTISIKEKAFAECRNLTQINLSNNVTNIGSGAFTNCENLISINIPEGVTTLNDFTFIGCSKIESVEIPTNVTNIGKYVFSNCENIKSINIPEKVINIGDNAFYKCISLTQINVDENNENYSSIDNVLYTKDLKKLIIYPSCRAGSSYKINSNTKIIGNYAFSNSQKIINIEIPASIENIGTRAFENCSSLIEINIPEGITKIGSYLFEGCSSLKTVNIPDSVTSIDNYAFRNCTNLSNLEIPNSVIDLKDKSLIDVLYIKCNTNSEAHKNAENNKIFYVLSDEVESNISLEYKIENQEEWDISKNENKSVVARWTLEDQTLRIMGSGEIKNWESTSDREFIKYKDLIKKIVVEGEIKNIAEYTFYDCKNTKSIELPDGLTTIGRMAFYSCDSLENINIPSSVTSIAESAFGRCGSLISIEIPDGVKTIQFNTFIYCNKLSYVKIPNSLTSIGWDAFLGCESLTSIEIPRYLNSIGEKSFLGCNNLTSIEVDNNNSNYTSIDGVLYSKDMKKILKYPAKKDDISYNIFDGVETIGIGSFQGCSNLTNIGIPNSVIKIDEYAFSNCTNLTNLELPSNLSTIGDSTFLCCYKLINIEIPDGVKTIPARMLEGCVSLKNVKMSKGVDKIHISAFSNCISLINLKIPNKEIVVDKYFGNYFQVICTMNSEMHKYAEENKILYVLVVSSDKYNFKNKKITKISPNITINSFLKNLNINADSVKIMNSDYEEIMDNKIIVKTSNKIILDDFFELDLIVAGDINGDGEVSMYDLMYANKHRLNKKKIEGVYFYAGDINEDGNIDVKDLFIINKYRLGKISA